MSIQAVAVYAGKVTPLANAYSQGMTKLNELLTAADRQPALIQNARWKMQTAAAVVLCQAAEPLAAIGTVPPEMAHVAELWQGIHTETGVLLTALTRWIDNQDSAAGIAMIARFRRLQQLRSEVGTELHQATGQ